ncbi:unnamed protein product [Allacma fusca]|uniref:Uncharacterized protein n=1 Tax=Allacma fusca TaxID=39272 RepID=A0A8J2PV92_9HEXA|nr:unnamed protein product [Allacma fusca]
MSRLSEFFIGFRNYKQDLKPWGLSKIHFLKSEWEDIDEPEVSWWYLIWRGCYALFCIFTLIFSICTSTHRHLWLIFLTRWSLVVQLIYSLLFFIVLVHHVITRRKDRIKRDNKESTPQDTPIETFEIQKLQIPNKNNKVESALWILTGIVGTVPVFVSVGYWLIVYPKEGHLTATRLFVSVCLHGINAIFALADTMINSLPVRVTHFVFLLMFGITYAVFSGLYEVAGGPYKWPDRPYIYPPLNWRENPTGAFINSIFAIIVMTLFYYLLWLLYILRLRLVSTCSSRRDRQSCHYLHQYWLHNKTITPAPDA